MTCRRAASILQIAIAPTQARARRTIQNQLRGPGGFAAPVQAAANPQFPRMDSEEESRKIPVQAHESSEPRVSYSPEASALEQFLFLFEKRAEVAPDRPGQLARMG